MRIGIIIPIKNRPEYTKECFDSLQRASIPEGTLIVLVDDGSDEKTARMVQGFKKDGCEVSVMHNPRSQGVKYCLRKGVGYATNHACSILINLDNDAIVRNDFIEQLLKLHEQFPDNLITGFNCNTLNADGSVRHRITEQGEGWNKKKTVGGINLLFTEKMYREWIEPALNVEHGNWDQLACLNAGNGVVCCQPSVIQHIGLQSSMGHSGPGREAADTAADFKPLHLPNVTLIGVDTNAQRLQAACDASTKDILFGAVKMITTAPIRSKQDYSLFCIRELYKHVDTEYMLIIQWDGYVLNYLAWNPAWLEYDYIGAPWWYTDGLNVGNGGFSLRTRRLMELTAQDSAFDKVFHPEDDAICRKRRRYLETQYGVKFAPDELARKFSIEGYNQANKTWSGEFGFHGTHVDRSGNLEAEIAVIQQYFGIGDIIFSMQIANELIKDGYKVLWPVKPEYVNALNYAYPQVTFVDYRRFQVNYDNKHDRVIDGMRMVPLRWTYETQNVPFWQCMRSKYDAMGLEWTTWSNASFKRNYDKELRLFKELGLEGKEYTLVNETFATDSTGKVRIDAGAGETVTMKERPGYSLFDWCMVFEKAARIHTVSTSIIYLLEMLELKASEIFIYIRRPNERNHDNYQYIMQRHADKYKFETP